MANGNPGRTSPMGEPPSVDSAGPPVPLGRALANRSLASWLESRPEAMLGAVGPNGAPREMPTSIPLGSGHQVDARSFLELVIPEDSRAVTDAFVGALARGIGVTEFTFRVTQRTPFSCTTSTCAKTMGSFCVR